jgi:hypothetical protein
VLHTVTAIITILTTSHIMVVITVVIMAVATTGTMDITVDISKALTG